MAERSLAKVAVSVTTLDPKLARTMEPRAATPAKRLDTIRQLAEAGIPAAVMVAPIIPPSTTTRSRTSCKPPSRPERGRRATCCCGCRTN